MEDVETAETGEIVEDLEAVESGADTDVLTALELAPWTLIWKVTVDPSLKVAVMNIGPGDWSDGGDTSNVFPFNLIQGSSGFEVIPVGIAPSCKA